MKTAIKTEAKNSSSKNSMSIKNLFGQTKHGGPLAEILSYLDVLELSTSMSLVCKAFYETVQSSLYVCRKSFTDDEMSMMFNFDSSFRLGQRLFSSVVHNCDINSDYICNGYNLLEYACMRNYHLGLQVLLKRICPTSNTGLCIKLCFRKENSSFKCLEVLLQDERVVEYLRENGANFRNLFTGLASMRYDEAGVDMYEVCSAVMNLVTGVELNNQEMYDFLKARTDPKMKTGFLCVLEVWKKQELLLDEDYEFYKYICNLEDKGLFNMYLQVVCHESNTRKIKDIIKSAASNPEEIELGEILMEYLKCSSFLVVYVLLKDPRFDVFQCDFAQNDYEILFSVEVGGDSLGLLTLLLDSNRLKSIEQKIQEKLYEFYHNLLKSNRVYFNYNYNMGDFYGRFMRTLLGHSKMTAFTKYYPDLISEFGRKENFLIYKKIISGKKKPQKKKEKKKRKKKRGRLIHFVKYFTHT